MSDAIFRYRPTAQHWFDKNYATELSCQGKMVSIKYTRPGKYHGSTKENRKITGFSNAARLGLLKKLAIWNWPAIGSSLFVTLTYPPSLARPTQEQRNIHRYVFHRAMERHYQRQISLLWRVEYVERKSGHMIGVICPHWHFLVLSEKFWPHEHVNEVWKKTIGWTEYCRTEVQGVKGSEAVFMYTAKYCSKASVSDSLVYALEHNTIGRHSGVLRQDKIPVHPKITIPSLTAVQYAWLREFASEFMPTTCPTGNGSFTFLGTRAEDAIAYFRANLLDIGQTIDDNNEVKGEFPAKSVSGHAAVIGTPAGTFSTDPVN